MRHILAHLGEATSPPRLMSARGPPLWQMPDAGQDEHDPQGQPAPNYEFDQRIARVPKQDEPPSRVMGRRVCGHKPGQLRPVL